MSQARRVLQVRRWKWPSCSPNTAKPYKARRPKPYEAR